MIAIALQTVNQGYCLGLQGASMVQAEKHRIAHLLVSNIKNA